MMLTEGVALMLRSPPVARICTPKPNERLDTNTLLLHHRRLRRQWWGVKSEEEPAVVRGGTNAPFVIVVLETQPLADRRQQRRHSDQCMEGVDDIENGGLKIVRHEG